jgi:hypothetical protein
MHAQVRVAGQPELAILHSPSSLRFDFDGRTMPCTPASTITRSALRLRHSCARWRRSLESVMRPAHLELAIERGWLWLHESGSYVKLTPAGAELFA